jgi:hypothetical protein
MQPYLKELIIWWEVKHRIKFNIYALLSGLFGIVLLKIFGLPVNFFMLPFVGIYAIAINLVYSSLWICMFLIAKTLHITISKEMNTIIFYLFLLYVMVFNVFFPCVLWFCW